MSLSAGTRVGPYEVLAPLGAGGMGDVYRARDTRLGREVALKVLPPDLLDDPQFRARFEREAQTLAALSHPHIAAIHDILEYGGQQAIVMEFVTGRTLADVITAGAIPPRLALAYAIQICEALAAAHAAGIVHRDLKPANVVVTESGVAKVLDFGIAKLTMQAPAGALDHSTRAALTGDHALVGTIGYMSPEQVHGRPVDGRSDLFSLGVLLHEMLTGQRAFNADSAAGLLSAVLRDDPAALRTVNPSLPRSLERVVTRCLQKDPRVRYQAAADLKIALEDAREDLVSPASGVTPVPPSVATTERWSVARLSLSRAGLVAAGAALAGVALFWSGAISSPSVAVPRYRPFITEAPSARWPAWSPDGKTLSYVAEVQGTLQVFVRGLDAAQPTQLTHGTTGVRSRPFWSPDGTRVYYPADGKLITIGIAGGEPQPIAPDVVGDGNNIGAATPDGRTVFFVRGLVGNNSLWTADTTTLEVRSFAREGLPAPLRQVTDLSFSPDGKTLGMMISTTGGGGAKGVWLIPWAGGPARHVLADAPYYATEQFFSWMPDSRHVVFNASPSLESASRLFVGDTATGTFEQITAGTGAESMPAVAPDGSRLAFVSARAGLDLMELPIDGGPPLPLLQSSRDETYPDMSASGVLAYVTDADGWPGVRLRTGSDTWSRSVVSGREGSTILDHVRLSPDGQRIAVDVLGDMHAIWIYPVAGGTPTRLDAESTDQHAPSWSPDGNWIAYRRVTNDGWALVKAPLGGGRVVRLAESSAGGIAYGGMTDWSATGAYIAYTRDDGVHVIAPDGTSDRMFAGPRPLSLRFSRDGSRLFAVRRGQDRRWQLAAWDVATGRELRTVTLPLATSAIVEGLSLSPDESRVILGAGTPTSDIWLLEQFASPTSWWSRWLRR